MVRLRYASTTKSHESAQSSDGNGERRGVEQATLCGSTARVAQPREGANATHDGDRTRGEAPGEGLQERGTWRKQGAERIQGQARAEVDELRSQVAQLEVNPVAEGVFLVVHGRTGDAMVTVSEDEGGGRSFSQADEDTEGLFPAELTETPASWSHRSFSAASCLRWPHDNSCPRSPFAWSV